MIDKTINKLPKSVVEVTVVVPWADLEPKWNAALQRLAADIEVSGFRKGQAPLAMVESQLGSKLQEEIFKSLFPQLTVEALQGTDIVPIDYPRYEVISFSKGQQLQFKALVTERPQVKVGEYKNIQVGRPAIKQVNEDDVKKVVEELFRRWKSRQPTQAPATVNPGESNGQNNGGSGSLSFNTPSDPNPGLVDVPNQSPSMNASSTVPDDNFALAVGALGLNDLKIKIKADLEKEAKFNNELDYEEVILQEVEKVTDVEVPEILIEDELNRMMVSLQKRVSEMGILLEQYLKSQVDKDHPDGRTIEDIKKEWHPQAERNVRMELGLAEIARREGVEISDTEIQAEVDKIPDAKMKAQFEAAEPRLHLKHSLRQMKTLNLLKGLVKAS